MQINGQMLEMGVWGVEKREAVICRETVKGQEAVKGQETMKYQEALEYMESLNRYGIIPGLDSIRRLCGSLGNPQDGLKFVHIAGTNGKGSVLAYVSTVLKKAGLKVGRYLSPVIFEYREKIQVGARPITQNALCEGAEVIRAACEDLVGQGFPHPTAFEEETALAFWYFRKMNCDIVVLETGMGGREDATNVVTNTVVSVLASISMDHMKFLGDHLSDIAWQKAGIMKPGRPVVSMEQEPEAAEVIQREASRLGCPLLFADVDKAERIHYGMEKQTFDYGDYRGLEISLAGKVQNENAVLAVEVIEALRREGYRITEDALRKGLLETRWPGRFSVIAKKPLFVVDGAHNEDAARKLAQSIKFYFTNKRIIYIMGVLKDKEYGKVIGLTHMYADQILTVTPPGNPRALGAYELAKEVSRVHPQVTAADSLEEAVEMAYLLAGREDVILAFGSLSYLGRLMKIVEKKTDKA